MTTKRKFRGLFDAIEHGTGQDVDATVRELWAERRHLPFLRYRMARLIRRMGLYTKGELRQLLREG
jgi:hypothetical protein